MTFSANWYRTPLHNGALPPGPLTPAQAALVACVRRCSSLADFYVRAEQAAPWQPPRGSRAPLEAWVRAYGHYCTEPQPYPLHVDCRGCTTQYEVVTRVLDHCRRYGLVITRAGDTRVTRAPDGSYTPAQPVPAE